MAKLSNKYIGNVGDSFRPLTGNGIFNFNYVMMMIDEACKSHVSVPSRGTGFLIAIKDGGKIVLDKN